MLILFVRVGISYNITILGIQKCLKSIHGFMSYNLLEGETFSSCLDVVKESS